MSHVDIDGLSNRFILMENEVISMFRIHEQPDPYACCEGLK